MEHEEEKNIRLVVVNEQSLYTTFSPEDEFRGDVKQYIKSKIASDKQRRGINLTVASQAPMDEERFRSAVSNWISEEKAMFRQNEKDTIRLLVGLLVFGSILLILSIVLQARIEVLKYSLLPIMGSLALSRATAILVIDIPTISAKRWMIGEMEKHNVINFEYGRDKKDISCGDDEDRQAV